MLKSTFSGLQRCRCSLKFKVEHKLEQRADDVVTLMVFIRKH